MADLPGTAFDYVPLAGNTDPYDGAQMDAAYEEIKAVSTWLGGGTTIASGGGIRLTLADGATVVGYCGEKAENDVAGSAQTVIPGGTYDVTAIVKIDWVVKASDGQVSWGTDGLEPGDSALIFEDDAGNELTLAISAGGEATVQRTGGGLTYGVLLKFLWI